MSKPIAAPINRDTEITREEIAKLAEVSISKVCTAMKNEKHGAPQPVRSGPLGMILYDRAAILLWLEKNDIKTIKTSAADRKQMPKKPKAKAAISDNLAVAQLQIGLRPKKFKGHGQSIRVHVPERNDIECPRAALTRFSKTSVEFTSIPSHLLGAFE